MKICTLKTSLSYASCDDRFRSLASYFKSHLKVQQDLKLNGFSVLQVESQFSRIFKLLLLYRSKNIPINQFSESLNYLLLSQDTGRRSAVVKRVEHISTILLVNI